jgi:hypothetical protein
MTFRRFPLRRNGNRAPKPAVDITRFSDDFRTCVRVASVV